MARDDSEVRFSIWTANTQGATRMISVLSVLDGGQYKQGMKGKRQLHWMPESQSLFHYVIVIRVWGHL